MVLSSEGRGFFAKRYGKLRGPQAGSSTGMGKRGRAGGHGGGRQGRSLEPRGHASGVRAASSQQRKQRGKSLWRVGSEWQENYFEGENLVVWIKMVAAEVMKNGQTQYILEKYLTPYKRIKV